MPVSVIRRHGLRRQSETLWVPLMDIWVLFTQCNRSVSVQDTQFPSCFLCWSMMMYPPLMSTLYEMSFFVQNENPDDRVIITARNEVGTRLCFYTCLWFCSHGGGCLVLGVCSQGVPAPEESSRGGGGCDIPACTEADPPGAVHAGRYGQQAGGTHPTGMYSCFCLLLQYTSICCSAVVPILLPFYYILKDLTVDTFVSRTEIKHKK